MIKKPEVIDSKIIYSDWFRLRVDKLKIPGAKELKDWGVVIPGDGSAVLAFLDDKTLLLEEQYRHNVGEYELELVQGGLKRGEKPIDGAKRELLEETGMAGKLEYLATMHPLPAVLDMRVHLYVAKELRKVQEPIKDPMEEFKLVKKPYTETLNEILEGKHHDSALVWAVLHYAARK